jgi:hypothetical protein
MSTIKSILIPYKASTQNSYILEISYKSIKFYTGHGIFQKNGEVYMIPSPYEFKDLFDDKGLHRISYVQNGDFLYLFHPEYPVKVIYRNKDNDWFVEDFEFKNGPWQHVNTTPSVVKVTEDTGAIFITSSIETFNSGDVGKLIRLTIENDSVAGWIAEKQYARDEYVMSDGNYYKCIAAGTSGTIKPTHTFGYRSDGGATWEYMHSGYGVAKIVDYVDAKKVKVNLLGEFPEEFKNTGTQYWELSVFGGNCVYPTCGAFYRGRFVVFADTNNIPTVYMSCSDDYNNFADKDFGEVLDNNAITIPLYSNEYTTASFLCAADVLFAGTSGGEFSIDAASSQNPLSPSNVQYKQFSSFGSLPIRPVIVGADVFYVSKQGTQLRNIAYSFERDGYEALDVSLFGKHLLYSGITNIVYQENPDKIIWITTNDGSLVAITYMREEKVFAFSRHDVGGMVEAVTVIPNPENNYEDLWLEVNRNEDRCIEWMDIGLSQDCSNSYFVDSGLSITRDVQSVNPKGFIRETTGAWSNKQIAYGDQKEINTVSTDDDLSQSIDIYDTPKHDFYISWRETRGLKSYEFTLDKSLIGTTINVYCINYGSSPARSEVILEGSVDSDKLFFTANVKNDNDTVNISFRGRVNKEDVVLSGLDHLEGKEVLVIVDGAETPRQIVNNGQITVPYDASNVVAGLPIQSTYIPQTLYVPINNGQGVGDVQRIDHVTLMLWNSLGGKVGGSMESLSDILFRTKEDDMDSVSPLYTGNKTILLNTRTSTVKEKGASIVVYNDSAYPMNILAIAPKFSTSGNGL